MCEECSTYGAQFKRMCIAVILCINDALWLIFSSFSIFLTDFTKNGHIKEKIVILRKNGKSGVDPPPSPTTPASYKQFFKLWWQLSTLW